MTKLVLNDIMSLANTSSAKQALNDNFDAIEEAFDDTLSRSGATPNQMEADIDLNGNDLLNVGTIDADQIFRHGVPIEQTVAYGEIVYQIESGNGSQTVFPLDDHPASIGNLEVTIAGVMQRPGLDYALVGQSVSFPVAPPSGTDNILFRFAKALPVGIADAYAVVYDPPAGDGTSVGDFLDDLGPLREDLANDAATFGADLVAYSSTRNVRERLDELVPLADLSSVVEIDMGVRFKDFFGYPTLDIDDKMFLFHGEGKTAGDDVFSVRLDRRADHDTGTFGFLNSALRINSIVTGAALSFENALSIIQDNYAAAGGGFSTTPQHHAMVVQHNKYNTAPGWCLVLEAVDRTGTANPTQGLGGIELDVQAAGTDSARTRYGITIISRRMGDLSGWTGAANTVGYGIVLAKQSDDAANNRFEIGLGMGRPFATTEFTVGIDFTDANCTVAGIRLANERLDWTADGTRTTRYEPLATALRYEAPAGRTFDMEDGGDFAIVGNVKVLGTQVVTSRRTGWGTMTGTATRSAYDTTTVTTAQLAERVKALIDDLRVHGLIGT